MQKRGRKEDEPENHDKERVNIQKDSCNKNKMRSENKGGLQGLGVEKICFTSKTEFSCLMRHSK